MLLVAAARIPLHQEQQKKGDRPLLGHRLLLVGLVAGLALAAVPSSAKTFRWANDGDVISMDPYARQETTLLR